MMKTAVRKTANPSRLARINGRRSCFMSLSTARMLRESQRADDSNLDTTDLELGRAGKRGLFARGVGLMAIRSRGAAFDARSVMVHSPARPSSVRTREEDGRWSRSRARQ